MGGALKAIGKIASAVAPIVSMINPMIGAALKFGGDLAQGKNPLQALMGAASSFIPGGGGAGGLLGNVLGKFGGMSNLMESFGGNGLIGSAMNLFGGQGGGSGITDILGKVLGGGSQSSQGMGNLAELAAQGMGKLFG
jgi:hypothetical protein